MAKGAAQIYGKNIVKAANKMTKAQIQAARKPVLADQAAARAALQGYGLAAGKLLSGIGSADQAAYKGAAQDEAGLAQGFSGAAQQAVGAAQQGGLDFNNEIGLKGADNQEQVNPGDLGNALYDQAGYIPGSSLESQGAAAAAWGNAQPAIQTSQTEHDITTSDANYAKQLLSIASQEPALRQSILHQLYGDALQGQAQNLVNAKFGEQVRVDNNNIARQKALTKQGQARLRQGQVRLSIDGQSLAVRQQSQKLAIQKAQRQGRQVDMNTSKARGYYVDNNGDPITTKNGKRIPFDGTASSSRGGSGGGKSGGATTTQLREAQQYAAKNFSRRSGGPPDLNNPLAGAVPFRKAQSYLVTYYGLTRAQARKILIGIGRKPNK